MPAPDLKKIPETITTPVDQPDTTVNRNNAITTTVPDGLTNGQLKPTNAPILPANEQVSSANVAVPVPSQKNMLTKSTMTMAPTQHFRIRLMTNEEVSATTTLPVHAQMFMGDVLELVCRKRKLDSNEYILTFADFNMIVPNDTTVESLHGIVDLCLIKKTAAAGLNVASSSYMWRSPNKKKKDELYPAALFLPNSSNPSANESSMSSYRVSHTQSNGMIFLENLKLQPLTLIRFIVCFIIALYSQSENANVCRQARKCTCHRWRLCPYYASRKNWHV
jgi:hypothetical protein